MFAFSTKHTEEIFSSSNGSLCWLSYRFSADSAIYLVHHEFTNFKIEKCAVKDGATLLNADGDIEWKWRACGFGKGEVQIIARGGGTNVLWIVPYWLVVTPITMLSAWSLLSKPRSSNRQPVQS